VSDYSYYCCYTTMTSAWLLTTALTGGCGVREGCSWRGCLLCLDAGA
jgi:hypothetical protein